VKWDFDAGNHNDDDYRQKKNPKTALSCLLLPGPNTSEIPFRKKSLPV